MNCAVIYTVLTLSSKSFGAVRFFERSCLYSRLFDQKYRMIFPTKHISYYYRCWKKLCYFF